MGNKVSNKREWCAAIAIIATIVAYTAYIESNQVTYYKKPEPIVISENIEDMNISKEIRFEDFETTEEQYESLRAMCRSHVDDNSQVTSINKDVKIQSGDFIDLVEADTITYGADTFYEADSIYFNNSLLVKYINDNGEMKSVISKLGGESEADITEEMFNIDNSTSLVGVKANEILVRAVEIGEDEIEIDTKDWRDTIEVFGVDEIDLIADNIERDEVKSEQYISEREYETIIVNLINKLVQHKDTEEANKYISAKLLDKIRDNGIKLEDVSVESIVLGKSRLDIEYKDRVLLKLVSKGISNSESIIVLKLNSEHKIYDIDSI